MRDEAGEVFVQKILTQVRMMTGILILVELFRSFPFRSEKSFFLTGFKRLSL
jgi:hypothetical protein